MDPDFRGQLQSLGYADTDYDSMIFHFGDEEFVAVPHPFRGLVLLVTYVGSRSGAHFETSVPRGADLETIVEAMQAAYRTVHPDKANLLLFHKDLDRKEA